MTHNASGYGHWPHAGVIFYFNRCPYGEGLEALWPLPAAIGYRRLLWALVRWPLINQQKEQDPIVPGSPRAIESRVVGIRCPDRKEQPLNYRGRGQGFFVASVVRVRSQRPNEVKNEKTIRLKYKITKYPMRTAETKKLVRMACIAIAHNVSGYGKQGAQGSCRFWLPSSQS